MGTVGIFRKDPDAVLPYYIDWSEWLEDGDTIAASDWTVDGCTKDSSTFNDTITTIVVSGGTVGVAASAINHITTANGYEDDRTITFEMVER